MRSSEWNGSNQFQTISGVVPSSSKQLFEQFQTNSFPEVPPKQLSEFLFMAPISDIFRKSGPYIGNLKVVLGNLRKIQLVWNCSKSCLELFGTSPEIVWSCFEPIYSEPTKPNPIQSKAIRPRVSWPTTLNRRVRNRPPTHSSTVRPPHRPTHPFMQPTGQRQMGWVQPTIQPTETDCHPTARPPSATLSLDGERNVVQSRPGGSSSRPRSRCRRRSPGQRPW